MTSLSPNRGHRVTDASLVTFVLPVLGIAAAQDAILDGKHSHTFKVQETEKLHYSADDVALRQGHVSTS